MKLFADSSSHPAGDEPKILDIEGKSLPAEEKKVICDAAIVKDREFLTQRLNELLEKNRAILNHHSILNTQLSEPSVDFLLDLFKNGNIDPNKALTLTNLSFSRI